MRHVGASLVAFQGGLLGVEKEMLPIYTLTEKLRATQKNIDLCVQELQHINKNFVVAQEVRPARPGSHRVCICSNGRVNPSSLRRLLAVNSTSTSTSRRCKSCWRPLLSSRATASTKVHPKLSSRRKSCLLKRERS